jgi:hypothetical protein
MKTIIHRGSLAGLAAAGALLLSACNAELAVLDTLQQSSADVTSSDASTSPPTTALNASCACASSPSLIALSCGGGEVPLNDDLVPQLTADGRIVAFNLCPDDFSDCHVMRWDGSSTLRSMASGPAVILLGLSASGDQLLVSNIDGLQWIDVSGATQQFSLEPLAGTGLLSAAGDVIFGATSVESPQIARVHVATGEQQTSDPLPGQIAYAYANADASSIVGTNFSGPPTLDSDAALTFDPFRWNATGLSSQLAGAPSGIELWPEAVSADGSVIAGRSPTTQAHFRWSEATGYTELAPASFRSETRISTDGSVVLGSLVPDGNPDGAVFRWTAETGAVNLTPGRASLATDMSKDGNVIVATSWEDAQNKGDEPQDTFIWDTEHGTRTLEQVLQDRHIDATGWDFGNARSLSGNGKVLVGRAHCGGVPTLYRLVLSD